MTYAISKSQSLKMQNLLKRLNKPHVKSIKSPDGDIIDCVLIHNQPAFDHPLLKNHTIQMRPSSFPKEDTIFPRESKEVSFEQVWHSKGSCPEGTIPIKRVTEEDILRASSIRRFGMKEPGTFPPSSRPGVVGNNEDPGDDHEYAVSYTPNGEYYGAKATMNYWEPFVQDVNEFSLSQLWVVAGPDSKVNSIEAGWHVYPDQNKDDKTRLFIFWTSDGYESTGCYNLQCPGFIQTNKNVSLGAFITPVSTYEGSQYTITIHVWKDLKDGNWWLSYGDGKVLGYWPASLFTYLEDSASTVHWGGEIVNLKVGGRHTLTDMGSGHFPIEGFGKASYFRNLQIVDKTNTLRTPQGITTLTTHESCYNIKLYEDSPNWGTYFYYGGPGRNPNCP
ncbi:uncharacterized protein LOC120014108 [Tripterygium wilfordii]|uniref:uncharacterized protein LOC120014108 n=1 Tax=Tripterygium wilfordii TaxID=458696 RepID=UPI0018F82DE5|nr:uncharacterized protein LOC120014108 [Tripterygium wilfordii]